MIKKVYKTTKENQSGRNIKSKNKKTLQIKQNCKLIQRCKKGKLPGYHVVKLKDGNEYLRSNPDKKKKNNLDPKEK